LGEAHLRFTVGDARSAIADCVFHGVFRGHLQTPRARTASASIDSHHAHERFDRVNAHR
jgi:hypothetical protein